MQLISIDSCFAKEQDKIALGFIQDSGQLIWLVAICRLDVRKV